jgi:hypothetical protein
MVVVLRTEPGPKPITTKAAGGSSVQVRMAENACRLLGGRNVKPTVDLVVDDRSTAEAACDRVYGCIDPCRPEPGSEPLLSLDVRLRDVLGERGDARHT